MDLKICFLPIDFFMGPVVRVDKLVGVGNTSQMMMKEMLFYVPGDQTLMLGVGIGNDSC